MLNISELIDVTCIHNQPGFIAVISTAWHIGTGCGSYEGFSTSTCCNLSIAQKAG